MFEYADIRALRKQRGMTQEQVGILAGMTKSQVSRMESGRLGSPQTYDRVLAALGYEMVVQIREVRPAKKWEKESILDALRVYLLYNGQQYGIERIGLFGSFARGEERTDSDIDIVISLKKPDLLLYASIAEQLETVFGRPVDLVSEKSKLKPSFLAQLQKDVIYV